MALGVVAVVGCQQAPSPPSPASLSPASLSPASLSPGPGDTRLTDPEGLLLTDPTDPTDPGAAGPIAMLRENLRGFDVEVTDTGRTSTPPPARRSLLGPSAMGRALKVSTRVPGEQHPAEHTIWVTTTVRDGASRLAGLAASETAEPQPLWLLEPVTVTRGRSAAVVTTRTHDPGPWLAGLERAADEVRRAGLPTGTLVAEIPSNSAQLQAMAATGRLRGVGAACWPLGGGVRILVHPGAGAATSGESRQVLLTHEAVHAATRSPHHRWPSWFVEGYADQVAVAERPGVEATLDQQLRDALRAGAPATLPAEDEFAPDRADLATTYGRARVGVRVLGDAAHRVQREISQGATPEDALRNNGWTLARLEAATADALARLKE